MPVNNEQSAFDRIILGMSIINGADKIPLHEVEKIIAEMPGKRQTLLFSITMPTEISKMVKSLLVNPS